LTTSHLQYVFFQNTSPAQKGFTFFASIFGEKGFLNCPKCYFKPKNKIRKKRNKSYNALVLEMQT